VKPTNSGVLMVLDGDNAPFSTSPNSCVGDFRLRELQRVC
jgi:hypothetical protein